MQEHPDSFGQGGRRQKWTRIGYALTAAWMVFVLVYTRNDPGHPLFNAIFLVPLIGWIIAVAAARIIGARRNR